MYFEILNSVSVADECDRRKDAWTDGRTETDKQTDRQNGL